jgi:hypothetical protein
MDENVYMTIVTLVAAEGNANCHLDSALVHDVIWAFAVPGSGLEHARVLLHSGRVDIAMFCMAPTAIEARSAAVALCEQACRGSPSLRGWADWT